MKKSIVLLVCVLALTSLGFGQWNWWIPRPAPIAASFTIAPLIPDSGEVVQFIDKSTGPVVLWAWKFGDGMVSFKQNPTHTYRREGFYTATLTVRDRYGRTNTLALTVMVNPAMKADFTWTPDKPVETLPMQFIDASAGVDIVRWEWNFGDGGFATEQNPVHTYAHAGQYVVTLTIWDSAGAKSQMTATI